MNIEVVIGKLLQIFIRMTKSAATKSIRSLRHHSPHHTPSRSIQLHSTSTAINETQQLTRTEHLPKTTSPDSNSYYTPHSIATTPFAPRYALVIKSPPSISTTNVNTTAETYKPPPSDATKHNDFLANRLDNVVLPSGNNSSQRSLRTPVVVVVISPNVNNLLRGRRS